MVIEIFQRRCHDPTWVHDWNFRKGQGCVILGIKEVDILVKNGPNARFEHKEKELGYKSVPQLNTLPQVGEVQRFKELNSKQS
jgi:hypothetical protein